MISIKDFCSKHDACVPGRSWAIANCKDMRDVWDNIKTDWLIWIATRKGVLTRQELARFGLCCSYLVKPYLSSDLMRDALNKLQGWVDGTVSLADIKNLEPIIHNEVNNQYFKPGNTGYNANANVTVYLTVRMISIIDDTAFVETALQTIFYDADDDIFAAENAQKNNAESRLNYDMVTNRFANWLRANTKPNFEE